MRICLPACLTCTVVRQRLSRLFGQFSSSFRATFSAFSSDIRALFELFSASFLMDQAIADGDLLLVDEGLAERPPLAS